MNGDNTHNIVQDNHLTIYNAIYAAMRRNADFSVVADAVMDGIRSSMPPPDAILEAVKEGTRQAVTEFYASYREQEATRGDFTQ